MKKLVSLLMVLTLTIGTLVSFNPKEVQAKSFEEKRALFCGKDFHYILSSGDKDSKVEAGDTFTLDFKCNGTATSYSAYINVYHPNIPWLDGYDYGSKEFTKKKITNSKSIIAVMLKLFSHLKMQRGKNLEFIVMGVSQFTVRNLLK
ncbi:Uncharacterised protein [Kurthia zopfii]|uniref:Uncharacterized protein n=1 Tax=Kurthia zopfii TaxID=1650 RepID=A0A8B4QCV6_9BACL|nr:hypothetical protein [Kurthia zopfii]TDR34355.1 hypothetical protein DFR61_14010 [Kurthia zopfii]STX10547.1 Uncharacterised protein [Kurthia zopfii]